MQNVSWLSISTSKGFAIRDPQFCSCNTLTMFVTAMEESDRNGVPQFVLDEARMLKWMSEDATGRAVKYASQRFALSGRYLQELKQGGLIDSNLLAEFRARHGNLSWRCLVRYFLFRLPIPPRALTAFIPQNARQVR